MDEDNCMVDVAKFFLEFTQRESCGKCTPCREGTKKMLDLLTKMTEGKAKEGDIDKLEYLAKMVQETSLCGLGQTAPNPVLTTIRYFRDEYEAHVTRKQCPSGACTALVSYVIDPGKCIGCTKCSRVCPVGAISGEVKKPHVIDQNVCIKCGSCEETCPVQAISHS